MSERKGVFTPTQEEFLATLVDNVVKFKNPFLEMVDGMVFKVLIQTVDNQVVTKIPEVWLEELRKLVDAAMNKQWEEVRRLIVDLAVAKTNVLQDAEAELLFFDGVTKIIMATIDWYVQRETAVQA